MGNRAPQVLLHCIPSPLVWVCMRCVQKSDVPDGQARAIRGRDYGETCPRCSEPSSAVMLVPATDDEIKAARSAQGA